MWINMWITKKEWRYQNVFKNDSVQKNVERKI